jgi:hypothetical protein
MRIFPIVFFVSLALLNCSEKEIKLSHEQLYVRASSAANDNNQIITTAEEIVNLTGEVLTDAGISKGTGRTGGIGRSCTPGVDPSYLTDHSHYDTLLYIGTMTVDYGNGNICPDASYKRQGKVIDNFEYIENYKSEIFVSKETIIFQSFRKDSVQIDGLLTIHANSGAPLTLETDKIVVTYPNGKSLIWKGILSFTSVTANGYVTTNTITGTISGITKRFEDFSASINTPVVYNYSCTDLRTPVPVSGSIDIVVGGNERSNVNYGNGTCDNVFALTIDGSETTHPLY